MAYHIVNAPVFRAFLEALLNDLARAFCRAYLHPAASGIGEVVGASKAFTHCAGGGELQELDKIKLCMYAHVCPRIMRAYARA